MTRKKLLQEIQNIAEAGANPAAAATNGRMLYSLKEASAIIGRDPKTLRNYIHHYIKGKRKQRDHSCSRMYDGIVFIKIGHRYFIERNNLEEWLGMLKSRYGFSADAPESQEKARVSRMPPK